MNEEDPELTAAKNEVAELRLRLAAVIGMVAAYQEPPHYNGTVYAGVGAKARDEILTGIRLLNAVKAQ